MASNKTPPVLVVPAWWFKNRNVVMAGLLGCDPGWLAIGDAYSATKAALWSATNTQRIKLAPEGIHGDTIHPGLPVVAAHRFIRGAQPPQVQHLPHETVDLLPLLVRRASSRAALLVFPRRGRRLSHGNLPRLRLSTQHRVAPALPLLWTPFAPWTSAFADTHAPRCYHAGRAALTTRHRYYEAPDFSLCTDRALRHRLIAQPSPPALRPRPRHEHLHRERNEISPGQTLLCPSVPPAHTLSRSTLRRYFLRLKAASSDQRAHGRPVRLALASATARRFDASPSDSISRWTPCPPRIL